MKPLYQNIQKFIFTYGISKSYTYRERKQAATNLQSAIRRYLEDGYNPFEMINFDESIEKDYNSVDALNLAFNHKKTHGRIEY
ncbi:hypothetical protein BSU00_06540 [Tenacibaculum sp. SG-28]|nr:hypothetical protein BSU00_06540 [Tenacibaculum sp. SG-28]